MSGSHSHTINHKQEGQGGAHQLQDQRSSAHSARTKQQPAAENAHTRSPKARDQKDLIKRLKTSRFVHTHRVWTQREDLRTSAACVARCQHVSWAR